MKAIGRRMITEDLRYRRLLVILVMSSAIIVSAVGIFLDRTLLAAVERDARHEILQWAEIFSTEQASLDAMYPASRVSAEGIAAMTAAATRALHVDIRLFDERGRPVPTGGEAASAPDPLAQEVIERDERRVHYSEVDDTGESPQRHAAVYLPTHDADGRVMGAARISVELPARYSALSGTLRYFGIGLPILCAVLFLLPSTGVLMGAGRARKSELAMAWLTRVDPLTGTLNRATLNQVLEEALEGGAGQPDTVGILAVDIDRLKDINETHGISAGDRYLRIVADLLRERLREGDNVGRLAGDMFVAMLPGIRPRNLEALANSICLAARQPVGNIDSATPASVSIGCYFARPGEGAARAVRAAELALREAKARGRDAVLVYHASMDAEDRRRRTVERALHGAWLSGRMTLYFQPIVAAKDARLLGYEALLRLRDEDGTPISPAEFIPVAEQTGIIHELGLETLERALSAAMDWPGDQFLSVNLSPEQFCRADLADRIAGIVQASGFPPARLELEITESLLLNDAERVAGHLVRLKAQGLSLALDDFGTGYSSLGYLFKFSFDKLKIDRVFLEGYSFESPKHGEIIEIIVLLGHKLGMTVVAEGVETQAQCEMLNRVNCDQMQGYLFGKAISAEEMTQPDRARAHVS